jgi:hypothetical protein
MIKNDLRHIERCLKKYGMLLTLSAFSSKKKTFDYQESALRNAIKGFYYFYGKYRGSKEEFFEDVYRNILPESFPISERLVDLYQNGYIIKFHSRSKEL